MTSKLEPNALKILHFYKT